MRHLLELLADLVRGHRCPWCGDRVRDGRLNRHWHLEHCGDSWSTR